MIALYILHRDGVPDEDRRRLYQHARLSLAEQDAVNALLLMGARISRGPGDRDTKRKLKQRSLTDDEYELSRFKPLLRNVIEVYCRVFPLPRYPLTPFWPWLGQRVRPIGRDAFPLREGCASVGRIRESARAATAAGDVAAQREGKLAQVAARERASG